MSWKKHWQKIIKGTFLLLLIVYIFVLLVDPYDTLSLSLPLDREPIVSNQRYSYPAIAQKQIHDSAIIGTSTIRLLEPDKLNNQLDAKFVNLAMNSATAYEQFNLFKLFVDNHPNRKYLIVGIDGIWCDKNPSPEKLTFRPFPPWLYDGNEFNDYLNILTARGIENSVRMIEYWTGKREAKYSRDGYAVFVGDDSRYDLNIAINNIYGSFDKKNNFMSTFNNGNYKIDNTLTYNFPVHSIYLSKILDSLPDNTVKILMFVPYHIANYVPKLNLYDQCKLKIARLSENYENSFVIDFMFPSKITSLDANYWDTLHYRIHIADILPKLINDAINRNPNDSLFKLLNLE